MSVIINAKGNFSVALFVNGSVEAKVEDVGTGQFPVQVSVNTNMGGGSSTLMVSGNETIRKDIKGIAVEAVISNWECTDTYLKFHVRVRISKSIIKNKVIFDQTLEGRRG